MCSSDLSASPLRRMTDHTSMTGEGSAPSSSASPWCITSRPLSSDEEDAVRVTALDQEHVAMLTAVAPGLQLLPPPPSLLLSLLHAIVESALHLHGVTKPANCAAPFTDPGHICISAPRRRQVRAPPCTHDPPIPRRHGPIAGGEVDEGTAFASERDSPARQPCPRPVSP